MNMPAVEAMPVRPMESVAPVVASPVVASTSLADLANIEVAKLDGVKPEVKPVDAVKPVSSEKVAKPTTGGSNRVANLLLLLLMVGLAIAVLILAIIVARG
jgi:hypothetical protein